MSVSHHGGDERVMARTIVPSLYPIRMAPSPDGRFVAYTFGRDLLLAPIETTADSTILPHSLGTSPLVRLSPGLDPRWDTDGQLAWTSGNHVYRSDPARALQLGKPVSATRRIGDAPPVVAPNSIVKVPLVVARAKPRGIIALVGARAITMKDDKVLDSATIVITDDRITAIGPVGLVRIPRGARVVDVRGKTIMPGIVDLHAHYDWQWHESMIRPRWELLANLAYGVTSSREVSGSPHQLATAELIETGELIGPRLFGVATAVNPPKFRLDSYDDAKAVVDHLKRLGVVVVKQYDQPTAVQRQWVIEASREAGLNVTGHNPIDMIRGGGTGFEHWVPTDAVYDDVATVLAATGIWLTPTHLGTPSTNPMAGAHSLYRDNKYRRFVPQTQIDERHRTAALPASRAGNTALIDRVSSTRRIVKRGGHVTIGSHGDYPGIGAHWEIWALYHGGFSALDALRAGTLDGARGLGVEQDLGSLERGKLADLLVLDGDPLAKIENTSLLRYVMKNGFMYAGETLEMEWPTKKRLPSWMYQQRPGEAR